MTDGNKVESSNWLTRKLFSQAMLLGLMLAVVMPGAQGSVIEHGSTWEGKLASPRGNNDASIIKRKLNHNNAEYSYNGEYYGYYDYEYDVYYGYYYYNAYGYSYGGYYNDGYYYYGYSDYDDYWYYSYS